MTTTGQYAKIDGGDGRAHRRPDIGQRQGERTGCGDTRRDQPRTWTQSEQDPAGARPGADRARARSFPPD